MLGGPTDRRRVARRSQQGGKATCTCIARRRDRRGASLRRSVAAREAQLARRVPEFPRRTCRVSFASRAGRGLPGVGLPSDHHAVASGPHAPFQPDVFHVSGSGLREAITVEELKASGPLAPGRGRTSIGGTSEWRNQTPRRERDDVIGTRFRLGRTVLPGRSALALFFRVLIFPARSRCLSEPQRPVQSIRVNASRRST